MTNKPAFGFDDLDAFKPRAKVTPSKQAETKQNDETEKVDVVAEQLGFSSRETQISRRRKKGVVKPTEQFNLRAHIEDINRFVEYAERTNKSYREVFQELVNKLT